MKTIISIIALAVLVLGIAPIAMATPVNSNSIIQDDIEYYMQTNKSIYDLGENVEMLYRITNLGGGDVTFNFGNSLMHDFSVTDISTNQEIWRLTYVDLSWAAREVSSFTLQPSHFKEFNRTWNQTTDAGTTNPLDDIPVGPGDYEVSGMLFDGYTQDGRCEGPYYVPVSVSIEIIPEPASLLLFGAGLFGLLARNRTSHKK